MQYFKHRYNSVNKAQERVKTILITRVSLTSSIKQKAISTTGNAWKNTSPRRQTFWKRKSLRLIKSLRRTGRAGRIGRAERTKFFSSADGLKSKSPPAAENILLPLAASQYVLKLFGLLKSSYLPCLLSTQLTHSQHQSLLSSFQLRDSGFASIPKHQIGFRFLGIKFSPNVLKFIWVSKYRVLPHAPYSPCLRRISFTFTSQLLIFISIISFQSVNNNQLLID